MDDHAPVNVTRLQIPIVLVVAMMVFALGGVISMTLVWAKTSDPQRHLEPALVTAGGGVAYQTDVRAARDDAQKASAAQQRITRKMLLGMKLTCKKADGELECKVSYLPEPE